MSFATEIHGETAVFRLAREFDQGAHQVCVWLDLRHDVEPTPMSLVDGGWEAVTVLPPVNRVEYLFVLRLPANEYPILDPANASQVGTASGIHSVLELPGYSQPRWLGQSGVPTTQATLAVKAHSLERPVPATIVSPAGSNAEQAMPLLLIHDGPEYEARADIIRFCSVMIMQRRLPEHRLVLLGPGDRSSWYSARPEYARALTDVVIPAVTAGVALVGRPALVGASLGALAGLHAATTSPGSFSGLFLQSGSFFARDLDPQEGGFPGFDAITGFVDEIGAAPRPTFPISMTCGVAEENLANNRRLARRLAALDYAIEFAEVPDAHTFTGWRDAFDPHLVALLRRAWSVTQPATPG